MKVVITDYQYDNVNAERRIVEEDVYKRQVYNRGTVHLF